MGCSDPEVKMVYKNQFPTEYAKNVAPQATPAMGNAGLTPHSNPWGNFHNELTAKDFAKNLAHGGDGKYQERL